MKSRFRSQPVRNRPRIVYREIVGLPDDEQLAEIFQIMRKVFKKLRLTPQEYKERLSERRLVFTIIGYHDNLPVAFKLGYEKTPTRFVSQLGGVLPKYRGLGIASTLMTKQHRWCFKKRKYKVVQTESMNCFREMMALNLKHRFMIVGTYFDKTFGDLKIMFEKRI